MQEQRHSISSAAAHVTSHRSASGHVEEPKGRSQWRGENKTITRIEKTGHTLRHTFRTLAGVAV